MNIYGEYFYGNKISDYGLEHNRVDYGTLGKAVGGVLNNDIMNKTYDIGYWEQESGIVDKSEEIDELQERIYGLQERIDELEIRIDCNTAFDDHIVCKEIGALVDRDMKRVSELEDEQEGLQERIDELEREMDTIPEVFQWYIVSDSGAKILEECNEIVYYNDELDMYLWGVTHWGTSWDYVLTDIPCNTGKFE